MPGSDVLALDNQVCFALYAANRAVTARYRPLLAELGLTYPQYLVMLVLWEGAVREGVRVTDIGERLRLDSGTLTPLLKRLEQNGLIERRRSKQDERAVMVTLTARGELLQAKARDVPGQLLCDSGMEAGKIAALRDELRHLLNRLEGD